MISWIWSVLAPFAIQTPAHAEDKYEESTGNRPQLFAPADLQQAGRITLSPTFSPDGRTIFFTQAKCARIWNCPQQLMRSQRTGTGWSAPQLVPQTAGERVDWPVFSADGRELLFSWATKRPRHEGRGVYEDFDLYRLDLGRPDAVPVPIDEPDINRVRGGKYAKIRYVNNETAPVLTSAGDLYFWSERLDGPGLRDVYVARSDGKGGFLKPQALPAPINSDGEDDGSWIDPSGKLMLINYADRGGSGGTDIFVSVRTASGWSEPRNLGKRLNSRKGDFAARLTPDLETIVFSSDRFARAGDEGVYQVWQMATADIPVLKQAIALAGLS